MKSKYFLLLLFLTASFNDAIAALPRANAARPNIIVILVDDMGFSDIGCYGSEIDTPNLDRLAADGLRFTQFYNAGRCCPTRASLMTGLHPHQTGIGHMTEPPGQPLGIQGAYQGYLNDQCTTIPAVLREAGYHTLMTGKWHLGQRQECWPRQRGFERYYGGIAGAFNYFKPGRERGMYAGNDPISTADDFYATDAFTDQACSWISEATDRDDRPFFLYLAYNSPHWPLNAKVKDFEKYRGRYRDGWEALMQRRQEQQRQLGLFDADVRAAEHVGPKWDSLSEKQRDDLDAIMAAYAGCIDSIDQNVGRLVSHLRKLNRLDNTVLFFLSDNGACQEGGVLGKGSESMVRNPPLETTAGVRLGLAWANACNTPFRLYKHYVHEGGACTPMIAHWPNGIPAQQRGRFVRETAYLPDFMATCLQLANADYPADVPPHAGQSLLPLLAGRRQPIHNAPIFFEHEGNAAVRWGNWKLAREYGRPWELYNIQHDRTEQDDLSTAEPDRKQKMIAMWKAWAKDHDVAFPERFNMYEFLKKKRRSKK